MQINIGDNLRKLRIKNELTQEKLAEVFGVSPQAISRWETSSTYPDLTLLPSIANYYSISIDELMGMNELRDIQKINHTFTRVHEYESQGMIDEAVLMLRDVIKIYPSNFELLSELALALTLKCNTDSSSDLIREAIALSEQVLLKSTNEKLRSTTKTNLCFLYLKNSEDEKAIQLAKTLPHVWECRELVLPEMHGEERYNDELKKGIQVLLTVICEKINNSKNYTHSNVGTLIAIGPNQEEDLKEKLEFITHFLGQ